MVNDSKFLISFSVEFSLKSDSEFTFPYQLQRKFMCSSITSIEGSASGSKQTLPHV